jgi:hypothetical protein
MKVALTALRHLVEPPAGVQVNGAQDGAPPVLPDVMTCWRGPRSTQVAPRPGQQVL